MCAFITCGKNRQAHLLSDLSNMHVNLDTLMILYQVVSHKFIHCTMMNFVASCFFLYSTLEYLIYRLSDLQMTSSNTFASIMSFHKGNVDNNSSHNTSMHSHFAQSLQTKPFNPRHCTFKVTCTSFLLMKNVLFFFHNNFSHFTNI